MRRNLRKRAAIVALAAVLVVGAASASGAVPPPMPPGTVVNCSQISGVITLRPGIGASGTSTGVKWHLKAVANNCTTSPNSAGLVPTNVVAAIMTGSGYFVGGNLCSSALISSNYGAAQMKVSWIAAPAVAATFYSSLPTGGFNPGTTLDATGITQDRNNAGPTPVNLIFGGDWTPASGTAYATDCSGAAPPMRQLFFQTGLFHVPAFIASI